jgi:hypothetical protein
MQQIKIWSITVEAPTIGEIERGMRKQWLTLDMTGSNRYQVRIHVDKVRSHVMQLERNIIVQLYDLYLFESDAEHLEFIDSLLADNMYRFAVAEHVEGGVRGPDPTQRVSKAANEWPASTLLPGRSNCAVYLHPILSSSE